MTYTLVDIQSTPYSSKAEIKAELDKWISRDNGDDEGIKYAIEQLERLLRLTNSENPSTIPA